ncbi:MAG: hypothetical protein HZB15_11600 [Actinobacteria bacterium]|nr:hypothetical protein [Actinomycetota bacterium]
MVLLIAAATMAVPPVGLVTRSAAADPADAVGQVDAAASVGGVAGRTPVEGDVVSINQFGELSDGLRDKAQAVARAINAPSALGRGFTIGLHAVHRGAATVQEAVGPGGLWQYPVNVTALPVDAIGRVMSFEVSSLVARGFVVMGQTSAALRGAQAGDTVDLVAADGGIRTFTIGAVVPDAEIGGTEIVMSFDQADAVGATIVTRVVIFGSFSRVALDEAGTDRASRSRGTRRTPMVCWASPRPRRPSASSPSASTASTA